MGILARSLVAKITVTAAIAVIVLTLGSVGLLVNEHLRLSEEALRAKAELSARMVASSVAEGVWNLSPADTATALEPLRSVDGFVGAVVRGERGEVFLATGEEALPDNRILVQRMPLTHFDKRGLAREIGTVEVLIDLRPSQEATRRRVLLFLLGGVAFCVACTVGTVFLIRGITAPITQMTQAMTELADGEIDIVVPGRHREDEIGRMARALRLFQRDRFDLREAKEAAERSEKAKTKFFAAASHDLRQPVQSLIIFAAILRSATGLPPEARRTVERLNDVTGVLKGLLDGLLDVARFDAGSVTVVFDDVDADSVLGVLRSQFEPIARKRGLAFRVEDAGVCLRTDKVLLLRLLGNLIENAIRYTPKGEVAVACVRDGGTLLVEVRDTGIGISEDQIEAIWEEFHQIGNLERNRDNGVGLGLAIVRRLSGALGHRVSVRSELGHGTVFSVAVPLIDAAPDPADASAVNGVGTLPAAPAAAEPPVETNAVVADTFPGPAVSKSPAESAGTRAEEGAEPPADTEVGATPAEVVPLLTARKAAPAPAEECQALVFVVDDDPVVLMGLEMFLESNGFRVRAFADGEEAYAAVCVEGLVPDAVLSDYHLAGENGLDLVARLRSAVGSDVPAAILSGGIDAEIASAAEAARVLTVHKPIVPFKLSELMGRLMEGRRSAA